MFISMMSENESAEWVVGSVRKSFPFSWSGDHKFIISEKTHLRVKEERALLLMTQGERGLSRYPWTHG